MTLTNRAQRRHRRLEADVRLRGRPEAGQRLNGIWSQSGRTVTVKNASYNARIAAGAAVSTGGQFTYSGTNTTPTSFAVNGTACAGAHQPPITVLTSPRRARVLAGRGGPAGGHGGRADGATISKVEFYDDTRLLATDTSSPFTHPPLAWAVGKSSTGGQGLRQHGRLRGFHAGRHHGRLGTDRGGYARPTGRPAG
ncbi:cellulose binding domain-containing protein [Streptomyces thinghirensis]|nr:cellulose binding domain-containing protein [Streptomyces thinghirensis]